MKLHIGDCLMALGFNSARSKHKNLKPVSVPNATAVTQQMQSYFSEIEDWVMILPRELEVEFWQEFKQFEQESSMTYMTTGERIGYERGKEEGQAEGQAKGQKALILKLLQKRLGELPQQVRSHIESLTLNQLDELGEVLLDFTSTVDLLNWLEANSPES